MKDYVSRKYLLEKWEMLKWYMEILLGGDYRQDNVAENAARLGYEICVFMDAIKKELGYD